MKYLIASDLHGSAYYTEKLLKCYDKEQADRLVLLGDILYHGPRNDLPKEYNPKKVAEMLNGYAEEILAVRGNCDADVDQMLLKFPILAEFGVIDTGETMIYLIHEETKAPVLKEGSVVLCGHTHVPKCSAKDGVLVINPGSVSIPKEDSHHGYLILEDDLFTWKDLDGNAVEIAR